MKKVSWILLLMALFCGVPFLVSCSCEKFDDPADLIDYVNGPKGRGWTMWKQTYYCGNKNNNAYFRHELRGSPDVCLIIINYRPAGHDFEYTLDRKKWIKFSTIKF